MRGQKSAKLGCAVLKGSWMETSENRETREKCPVSEAVQEEFDRN